jgi:hypothetical protein
MNDSRIEAPIQIGLAAAIVAVEGQAPQILVGRDEKGEEGLPYGSFDPLAHRTLEIALRAFVAEQSGLALGYVEQLYTFADRGRHKMPDDRAPHVVSIGYLALTRVATQAEARSKLVAFRPWYRFFPWEDWRGGRPSILDREIMPRLSVWAEDRLAEQAEGKRRPLSRLERLQAAFGSAAGPWDEEKVLERYELLYEAGLVFEAGRDGRSGTLDAHIAQRFGEPMRHDHRRILATAMGRLRAKLKYRPVIFELMPEAFTLTALQSMVEAISGRHLHKQNFRRLVETTALVEPTGSQTTTRGRPAALFRFRRDVVQERPAPGLRVGKRG